MINVKIGLMLIASSAIALIATSTAKAEQYPQFVEIVKKSPQSSPCKCVTTTSDNLNQLYSDAAILNDDKIGDKAIAKFGCDCAAHRRAVAQMLINQIN